MIKFSDLKKKIKAKFENWDTKLVQKLEAWRTRRIMVKVAKQFPNEDIDAIKEDNHTIHIDPSRIPTDFGKVLDIKAVNLGGRAIRGKFWYASKKEDVSGTTEYEIRDDQQCQEAFKKIVEEQQRIKRERGYFDGF